MQDGSARAKREQDLTNAQPKSICNVSCWSCLFMFSIVIQLTTIEALCWATALYGSGAVSEIVDMGSVMSQARSPSHERPWPQHPSTLSTPSVLNAMEGTQDAIGWTDAQQRRRASKLREGAMFSVWKCEEPMQGLKIGDRGPANAMTSKAAPTEDLVDLSMLRIGC